MLSLLSLYSLKTECAARYDPNGSYYPSQYKEDLIEADDDVTEKEMAEFIERERQFNSVLMEALGFRPLGEKEPKSVLEGVITAEERKKILEDFKMSDLLRKPNNIFSYILDTAIGNKDKRRPGFALKTLVLRYNFAP